MAETDLLILIASRGRPHNAIELEQAFVDTQTEAKRLYIVDFSDETRSEYARNLPIESVIMGHNTTGGMAHPLNHQVRQYIGQFDAFAWMGDDHRPRTLKWDRRYVDEIYSGSEIVYGNDLLQGEGLPTQCAVSNEVVEAVNGFFPNNLRHLYLDNFLLQLGKDLNKIKYLPDVIVEHCHPYAGKAPMDEGYARVNAAEVYSADKIEFDRFMASADYQDILAKLR